MLRYYKNLLHVSRVTLQNKLLKRNYLHYFSAEIDPQMASIREELFQAVADDTETISNNKVTVVGIGAVGMASAFSILTQVGRKLFLNIFFILITILISLFFRMFRVM
jgi:hypothetical protein